MVGCHLTVSEDLNGRCLASKHKDSYRGEVKTIVKTNSLRTTSPTSQQYVPFLGQSGTTTCFFFANLAP